MNKQVVSFLSLFSLVLVLSIYFVMVPAMANNQAVAGINPSDNTSVEISDASSLYFTTLEQNRKARHEENKAIQVACINNKDSSNELKQAAHEKIELEEARANLEKSLEASLVELEFNETFVELLDCVFHVTVYDGTIDNKTDVANVDKIALMTDEFLKSQKDLKETYSNNPIVNFVEF